VFWLARVFTLFKLTLAFGIAAPLGFVTVPEISPVVRDCTNIGVETRSSARRKHSELQLVLLADSGCLVNGKELVGADIFELLTGSAGPFDRER
jgi:hypothetical protein